MIVSGYMMWLSPIPGHLVICRLHCSSLVILLLDGTIAGLCNPREENVGQKFSWRGTIYNWLKTVLIFRNADFQIDAVDISITLVTLNAFFCMSFLSEDTVMLCRRDVCPTSSQLYNKLTTTAVPILVITFLSPVLSPFIFLKKFCHRPMEIFFYWLPERASINKTSVTSVPLVAICLGCN